MSMKIMFDDNKCFVYPDDWENKKDTEKQKKLEEYKVVLFLLNDSIVKSQFVENKKLFIEFYEKPDFILYQDGISTERIGIEVTQSYIDKEWNHERIYQELNLICKRVIDEIRHSEDFQKSLNFNYADIVFYHEVMVNGHYNINRLKSELKQSIINENNYPCGEYIKSLKIGCSLAYPRDNIKITINSDMAYIVPKLKDISMELDPILRCVSEKENKLDSYKKKSDSINKWWLCIDIPERAHLNPVSYNLPADFKSKFNRIYLVKRMDYGIGVYLIYNA